VTNSNGNTSVRLEAPSFPKNLRPRGISLCGSKIDSARRFLSLFTVRRISSGAFRAHAALVALAAPDMARNNAVGAEERGAQSRVNDDQATPRGLRSARSSPRRLHWATARTAGTNRFGRPARGMSAPHTRPIILARFFSPPFRLQTLAGSAEVSSNLKTAVPRLRSAGKNSRSLGAKPTGRPAVPR